MWRAHGTASPCQGLWWETEAGAPPIPASACIQASSSFDYLALGFCSINTLAGRHGLDCPRVACGGCLSLLVEPCIIGANIVQGARQPLATSEKKGMQFLLSSFAFFPFSNAVTYWCPLRALRPAAGYNTLLCCPFSCSLP